MCWRARNTQKYCIMGNVEMANSLLKKGKGNWVESIFEKTSGTVTRDGKKKIGQWLTSPFPVTIPETVAGRISIGPSSLLVYKVANRPLPNSKNPHFQNEAKHTTFLVKMSFICLRMKNHFHIKGWVLNLVFIQRPRGNSEMAYSQWSHGTNTLRLLFKQLNFFVVEVCIKFFKKDKTQHGDQREVVSLLEERTSLWDVSSFPRNY